MVQGEVFAQGQPDGLFQGFPAYFSLGNPDENYLVIPRNNRPLFRPVTVGRMIRWQITQFDEELKRQRALIDGAKQQYDAYFSPTAKAEEERIIGIRIERERATTPAAQARIRANREAENAAATKKSARSMGRSRQSRAPVQHRDSPSGRGPGPAHGASRR